MDKLRQEKEQFERDMAQYQKDLDFVRTEMCDYSLVGSCVGASQDVRGYL